MLSEQTVWEFFDYPRNGEEAYHIAYSILEDSNCHAENRILTKEFGIPEDYGLVKGLGEFSAYIQWDICDAIYAASVVTKGYGDLNAILTEMALNC
jgi:hypothetical protein